VLQQPIDGMSMLYSLGHPDETSPRHEQYFETFGNMALYESGWMLSSRPQSTGESLFDEGDGRTVWELYDLDHDFSQAHDLAAQAPKRVAAMTARFRALAVKYHVNPISRELMSRTVAIAHMNPVSKPGRYSFYNGPTRYNAWDFPDIRARSWSLEAKLTAPEKAGDGMIATEGGHFAGWGLMVLNGHATFLYRMTERAEDLQRISDPDPLAPGPHLLRLDFKADQEKFGTGGKFSLAVDGKVKAGMQFQHTVPFSFWDGAEIGRDYGSALSDDYPLPFLYPGRIERVDIDTGVSSAASSPAK
jgi:arylsulfatase